MTLTANVRLYGQVVRVNGGVSLFAPHYPDVTQVDNDPDGDENWFYVDLSSRDGNESASSFDLHGTLDEIEWFIGRLQSALRECRIDQARAWLEANGWANAEYMLRPDEMLEEYRRLKAQ